MLIFVVFSSSFTFVLGFNASSLFVAILELRVDIVCHIDDVILDLGNTLDFIGVHFSLIGLRGDVLFDFPLHRRHRNVRNTGVVKSPFQVITLRRIGNVLVQVNLARSN
jgi:hypothetical protein